MPMKAKAAATKEELTEADELDLDPSLDPPPHLLGLGAKMGTGLNIRGGGELCAGLSAIDMIHFADEKTES